MINKPYTFETKLNDFGDTVVFIKKGKYRHWLFNIVDGKIDVTVPANKSKLEKMGLKATKEGLIEVILK